MQNTNQIFNIVIGTAGHIDHGKTSLVRKLTGIDPDRLKEEQERGMTIDLGFANFLLPDGRRVGMIDVPGHERFVKNMVAGAAGIDFVVLVIAADDSVMPQTREHMDIMKLLGIRRGMIALTKIDLVEPDMVELVAEDIKEFVAGTFLEGAPICPLSTVTGQGFEEFKRVLFEQIGRLPGHDTHGPFRMPVQRVFSAKGEGAVLTGIPVSGEVHVGDQLAVQPPRLTGKVRKIQAYHQEAQSSRAGHSSALNMAGVDYKAVKRGDVVCAPGYFSRCTCWGIKLSYLGDNPKPLKDGLRVRFHTGTAEITGKLVLLGQKTMNPGEEGVYAQVILDEELVAASGDRYVIRLESPMITIGGGVILEPIAVPLKRNRPESVQRLQKKDAALGKPEAMVQLAVENAQGLATVNFVRRDTNLLEDIFMPVLESLVKSGKIIQAPGGKGYLGRPVYNDARERLTALLKDFHAKNPSLVGLEETTVKAALHVPEEVFGLLVARMMEEGALRREGLLYSLAAHSSKLSPQEETLLKAVETALLVKPFAPPSLEELEDEFGDQKLLKKVVSYMLQRHKAVRIEGFLFHADALEKAKAIVAGAIPEQGATTSELREKLDTTRKYAVPLLEYLDGIGFTVRRGELRFKR